VVLFFVHEFPQLTLRICEALFTLIIYFGNRGTIVSPSHPVFYKSINWFIQRPYNMPRVKSHGHYTADNSVNITEYLLYHRHVLGTEPTTANNTSPYK
jgi:hypothetical protein